MMHPKSMYTCHVGKQKRGTKLLPAEAPSVTSGCYAVWATAVVDVMVRCPTGPRTRRRQGTAWEVSRADDLYHPLLSRISFCQGNLMFLKGPFFRSEPSGMPPGRCM